MWFPVILIVFASSLAYLLIVSRMSGAPVVARVALVFARAGALAALALLVWKVFDGTREVRMERPAEAAADPEVIVLQDASASMRVLGGGDDRTREELAESVWTEVRRRARAAGRRVERWFFGANLVEEKDRGELARDGTRLSRAFTAILSREALRSLLVVSDGASTDGLPPPWLVDWARNRRVRVGGVVACGTGARFLDRSVGEVRWSGRDPAEIEARIRCAGGRGPVTAMLEIDGAVVTEITRPHASLHDVVFRVPSLEPGWHGFAVGVRPVAGEATELNNRFHGVFRVEDRERVLLVHGEPRVENVHLARLLRNRSGRGFRSVSAAELADGEELAAASLVVVADVAPEDLPDPAGLGRDGAAPVLLLGGRNLDRWARRDIPSFPVRSSGSVGFLGPAGGRAVAGSASELREVFEGGKPPVDLVRRVELGEGAQVLCAVERGEGEGDGVLPLAVAGPGPAPAFVVVLTETTWKWARDRRGEVRRAYDRFWTSCVERLLDREEEGPPLVLGLETGDASDPGIRGRVVLSSAGDGVPPGDCRVGVSAGGWSEWIETTEQGGARTFRFVPEEGTSGLLWFQAFARSGDREIASRRVPVALNPHVEELRVVAPREDVLARCTTGSLAWYPDRSAVIDSLFSHDAPPPLEWNVPQRESSWEMLFAGAAALFLAFEWWLERRLNRGGTP